MQFKTDKTIDLTVVVTVHNVENFLPQCLESLSNQTLDSAEFIIVDDGSTDSSGAICDQFEMMDPRFSVLHQPNEGTLCARNVAIKLARGKWIIFADGYGLLPFDNVLTDELDIAEKTNVDILCFEADLIVDSICIFDSEKVKKEFSKSKRTFRGTLSSSEEIIEQVFQQETIGYNVCDKIFRAEILKKAQQHMLPAHYGSGGNQYLLFVTSFFANSLCSIDTQPFYLYRPIGGNPFEKLTLIDFGYQVQEIATIGYLADFLKKQGEYEKYKRILNEIERRTVKLTTNKYPLLSSSNALEGFNLLVSNNPIEYVVENLYQIYRNNPTELAKRIYRSKIMRCNKRRIKTIAVCYPRIYNGGVERGISHQLPMFLSLGLRVVLITDEIREDIEYPIPDAVDRVVVPGEYAEGRAFALSEAIKKYKIETVLYHAASHQRLLFDLILVKALGCSIIVYLHELTTQSLAYASSIFGVKPHIYRLADALLVMNYIDLNFYKNFGISAHYIPNSLVEDIDEKEGETKDVKVKSVVWIGRLENTQKNYTEALEIFKQVIQKVPSAVCYMVGDWKLRDSNYVKEFIDKNQLGDRLKYVGFTTNVKTFYLSADVHLVTSSYESFCRVIAESKAYGVPLVLYDMPYLEILKDHKGYVSVPRHDKEAACAAIVGLLIDDAKRKELGKEARQSFLDFVERSGNQLSYWKNLLQELSLVESKEWAKSRAAEEQQDLNFLFWDTSASLFQEGIDRKNRELNQIKRNREKISNEREKLLLEKKKLECETKRLKQERENLIKEKEKLKQDKLLTEQGLVDSLSRESSLKKSVSFRIGRTVTWFPRKIRGGIKCFNQHGLVYTIRRLCWHIVNFK